MEYKEFVGQVQSRAQTDAGGEAIRAIQATLEILSRRLSEDEVKELAAQLPDEIASYMDRDWEVQGRFGLDEFFHQVSANEGTGLHTAVLDARAVISVLCEAISEGEIINIRKMLPEDYAPLFEPLRTENVFKPHH